MEVQRVIATGCSYVEGSNITNFDGKHIGYQYRASKLLADRFNAQEINIAVPGSGNSYMINNLVNKLYELGNTEGTIVMIGLSGLTRMEEYVNSLDAVRNLHLFDILSNEDSIPRRAFKITGEKGQEENFYNYVKFKAKYLFNEDYEKLKLRNSLLMLHAFLKSKNIPYVLFNSIEDNLTDIKQDLNYLSFQGKVLEEYKGKPIRKSDYYKLQSKDEPLVSDCFQHYIFARHLMDFNGTLLPEDRLQHYPFGKYLCGSHPSPNSNIILEEKLYTYLKTKYPNLKTKAI